MSSTPCLMVLYSNDAVEVRYTDQTCLQIAPCGSTFVHHEAPGHSFHPAHGVKSIYQRCQYVTSEYRYKVLQALDFRNRFAERPFVSEDLIAKDQIVAMYATVRDVAWQKEVEKANYEFLPDGGVRLISEDEYASIVLSPNRQDFTVCYLSRVSEEPIKARHKVKYGEKSQVKTYPSNIDRKEGKKQSCENKNNEKSPQNKDLNNFKISVRTIPSSDSLLSNVPELECSPRREDTLSRRLNEELTMSPISMASDMRSCHSSPEEPGHKDINRYSTPTAWQDSNNDNVEIGGQRSAFRYNKRQTENDCQNGSFLDTIDAKNSNNEMKSDDPDKTLVCDSDDGRVGDHEHSDQHCRLRSQMNSNGMMGALEGTQHLNEDPVDVNEDSKCRCLYSWMTKHFSCDECPLPWSHAVNLARAVMANREQLEEKALKEPFTMKKSQFDTIKLSEKVRQSLSLSTLPVPLPLTCPAQYLHRQLSKYVYDQDKDPMENIATFKQGKLKVLMVEGIIFRILRLNSTKSVEIYPGDGSVILSQGAKGLYYRHIVPSPDGSIEEKTYSIKSLPPKTPGSSYSVEKLVRRANRILNQAVQEDKTLTAGDIYCWKHKLAVVQPLSTYLLEECTVPGYGRFTAFSNGHVRILFEDRTSLDMDCDFSKRIECCLQHSEDGTHMPSCEHLIPSTMRVNTDSRLGFCKLLLTNGQYQIVDVRKPGLYRKYTDTALEWASWVNSSPSKRKHFYKEREQQISHQQMIASELQRIKCFNYIVDNVVTVSPPSHQDGPPTSPSSHSALTDHVPASDTWYGSQHKHVPSDNKLCKPTSDTSNHAVYKSVPSKSIPCDPQVPPNMSVQNPSALTGKHVTFRDPSFSHSTSHLNSIMTDQSRISTNSTQNNSTMMEGFNNMEMLQGFNSVRQALLKTSKVINDIDDILENRKC